MGRLKRPWRSTLPRAVSCIPSAETLSSTTSSLAAGKFVVPLTTVPFTSEAEAIGLMANTMVKATAKTQAPARTITFLQASATVAGESSDSSVKHLLLLDDHH